MTKYYKVVCDNNMSHRYSFEYTVGKWHHKNETMYGTSFFVFTTLEAAEDFRDEYMYGGLIYECEIKGKSLTDPELGHITRFKDNAVFAESVRLIPQPSIKSGMVFRVKRTKKYVQLMEYDEEQLTLIYIGGKTHGKYYDEETYGLDEYMIEFQQNYPELVYCPNAKVQINIEVE